MRAWLAVAVAAVLNLLGAMLGGYLLLSYSAVDELGPADAVVVLGGHHDGREDYGVRLAKEVGARTVLLSNPYAPDDKVMRRLCGTNNGGVEVVCQRPDPATTRGEAMLARNMAVARDWRRIVVVTWRYHLPRARIVFAQCYSEDPHSVIMRPAPRTHPASPLGLLYYFQYQYVATWKALLQGPCR